MKKSDVSAKKAPAAVGPYSQAVKFGDLLFCSGQIGVDPKTNNLVGNTVSEQAKQVFENLKTVLEAGGSGFDNVLKVNVYLKNMDDFSVMNEIYARHFEEPYPARATVEVARLPRGALIEIECIAYSKDKENCCAGDCNCC